MNKYFKKRIAIVLMLSIIITSQRFTVFAGVSNNISKDIEIERVDKTVYKDIQLMKKIGISSNEDNPLKLVNLSKKSYCVDDSTIIQIIENSDKRIELRITEGNKVDNVVFTNDGKTYLDNKQVIVTDSEGNEILHNMFAEPKVGYSIYYKKTCPYGSSGDYTHYYGQEKSANISLGKDITALSVVAFRAFMLTYLGVAGEVASNILEQFYNILITTEPTTSALSYKADMYSHKNYKSGYIPSQFTFIWKYNLKLYPKTNFSGSATTKNVYKCKMTV